MSDEKDVSRGRALYNQGREAVTQSRITDATGLFRESLLIEPHFKTAELLGECLRSEGKLGEAAVAFAAAAGLGIRQYRGRLLLAEVLAEMGSRANALQQVDEALRVSPENGALKKLRKTLAAPGADRERVS